MNYIKEIFLGKPVDYMHGMFARYGRGTFEGPLLTVKNGPSIKAEGSVHYANILGQVIAESTQQEFSVSGAIHAKREIKVPLKTGKETKKGDIHSVEVKDNMHSDGLKMVYGDYRDAYVLLELSAGKWRLKCKKKPPKPGGSLDAKFCSATLDKTALDEVMEEILFDVRDRNFREAEIRHEIVIEELVGPPELKKDPAKFRTQAKRRGRISRRVTVDGRKTETTQEFSV